MDLDEFCQRVAVEVGVARRKYPNEEPLVRLAALSGEVGELAEGYLKNQTRAQLWGEAIQVAATAFRAAAAIHSERERIDSP